jgi:hypothetical protein
MRGPRRLSAFLVGSRLSTRDFVASRTGGRVELSVGTCTGNTSFRVRRR